MAIFGPQAQPQVRRVFHISVVWKWVGLLNMSNANRRWRNGLIEALTYVCIYIIPNKIVVFVFPERLGNVGATGWVGASKLLSMRYPSSTLFSLSPYYS